MDIALHFENAAPAAVFDEHAGEEDDSDESTGEGEEGNQAVPHAFERRGWILRAVDVGPDSFLESFVGLTVLVLQVGEEVELGVSRDLGMSGEEEGELGIVARDVLLVGEERRVMRDDGRECRAEAEQVNEFGLGGADVAIVGRGGNGWRGPGGWSGWVLLSECRAGK